jgi:hypothetical protein
VVDFCVVWGENTNNHLVTDDPSVARELRKVRVGDQVRSRSACCSRA